MKVWILQTGEPLHSDGGMPRPMRAMNLADSLMANGHSVEVFSSAFYHQEKRHRTRKFESIYVHEKLTIHLIPTIGYKQNIGLGRLVDHAQMALNLWRLLGSKRFAPPDLAIVGYPPIEVAWVMLRWLKSKNIPSVIDVKDQWPSLFIEAVPIAIRPVAKLVFAPYFWLGKRAIRDASAISSMTQPFLAWALNFSGRLRQENDTVVPLVAARTTVSVEKIVEARHWWAGNGVDLDVHRCFSFVGSISSGFDFSALRAAAERLQNLHPDCRIVICGSGSQEKTLRSMFTGLPNVLFPGWVDASKIAALMQATVATLAPYRNTIDFQLSIPNKVLDSFSFGRPLVTALHGEVEGLVDEAGVGIVCTDTGDGWLVALCRLLGDSNLLEGMSRRAIQLYAERYDAAIVYGRFVHQLEKMTAEYHERQRG